MGIGGGGVDSRVPFIFLPPLLLLDAVGDLDDENNLDVEK